MVTLLQDLSWALTVERSEVTFPSRKIREKRQSDRENYGIFCQFGSKLAIAHTIAIKWKEKYDAVVGLVNCHHSLLLCGRLMRMSHPKFFMPPKELWEAYSNRTVRPSIPLRVRCISPIFFEVGIPNLMCGYILRWRSVAYHFQVTVTLTLTSELFFNIIVSGAYILYYLR